MAQSRCFGRLPRTFDSRIPHLSALSMSAKAPAPIPVSHDWAAGMPADLLMLMNDSLGDCTCAAVLHALQVWTHTTATMQVVTDTEALWMYENWAGYVPGDPSTDQGANEQTILTDWLKNGVLLTGGKKNHISAFIEVDPRNLNDVRRAIYESGLVYIGFEVPQSLENNDPPLWEIVPGQEQIVGGHAIVLTGYDATTFSLISWGQKFKMTTSFFSKFTDEVYALVDHNWATATGKTPLGISLQTLIDQMKAL